MKKFHQLKVFSVILLLSVGLWRCYDEPLEEYSPQTRQGQLTVQEAHSLFMEYASNLTLSRSITPGASRIPLNPGIITPAWEEATLSTTNVNSYVNVPIQTTNAFAVKSPRNDTWVDVIQKLVVVQDDGSHRRNVYLLSIIPEKEFARKSPAEIMRQCDGGNMPDDFSGLIVYTKPQGGIPVYAGSFQDGKLSREIFLFNKTRSFQENLTVLNNILKGYTIRSTTNVPMSRSFSEGGWTGGGSTGGGSTGGGNTGGSGYGGGGDDWQFHTEGDPFTRDGYTCWNSSDGNGNSYIVADTDGDGKPDTIIDNDTDVNPGGGETGGNTGGIGGNTGGTGGNTGESGGDVNPGGGGYGGGSGGGTSPTTVSPTGELSKKIFSKDSRLTKEQWHQVEEALKNINQDCMGGKLIGELLTKEQIKLIQRADPNFNAKYNPSTNILSVKDFFSQNLETTLLHELFHSTQPYDHAARLNREIEVQVMLAKYQQRNGKKYTSNTLAKFVTTIGVHNCVTDKGNITNSLQHEQRYEEVVDLIKTTPNSMYHSYLDIPSERNYRTLKKLSIDC